jgi:hypothetical protein
MYCISQEIPDKPAQHVYSKRIAAKRLRELKTGEQKTVTTHGKI